MNQNCTASFSVYNNGPETLIYYSDLFLYHDHIRWSFLFPLLHCRKLIWNIIMLLPKISMAVELQSAHCLLGDIVWYCPLIYHGPFLILAQFQLISQLLSGEPAWIMVVVGLCLYVFVLFVFIPGQQWLHNAALKQEETQRFVINPWFYQHRNWSCYIQQCF